MSRNALIGVARIGCSCDGEINDQRIPARHKPNMTCLENTGNSLIGVEEMGRPTGAVQVAKKLAILAHKNTLDGCRLGRRKGEGSSKQHAGKGCLNSTVPTCLLVQLISFCNLPAMTIMSVRYHTTIGMPQRTAITIELPPASVVLMEVALKRNVVSRISLFAPSQSGPLNSSFQPYTTSKLLKCSVQQLMKHSRHSPADLFALGQSLKPPHEFVNFEI
ncbi:hypothetical protein AUEXF2481DRAFT_421656 [Aureobasidium subglaciale EXF-2481]|uniref:Uncharacterized protein n=1 Tax=Aureobasidium subglaciale (strain EXF-2481) TaxID=1043005 RepID=A0A074YEH1_AURSE|nr:uncharacterized protein AUEXF2481DRAFT_421656 [Aureobasidium subglaciale EXF-2481]KEQ92512.1 hypothetical protein AUEXF2481DRAFT_421656 [Aureobasidium subglaciale EXF-2481]